MPLELSIIQAHESADRDVDSRQPEDVILYLEARIEALTQRVKTDSETIAFQEALIESLAQERQG